MELVKINDSFNTCIAFTKIHKRQLAIITAAHE
jgi:hypothetical protein